MIKSDQEPNGMRIRWANIAMLAISLPLFAALIYTTAEIASDYRANVEATENYIRREQAAHAIHLGSDYLTDQARLYVENLQPEHVSNYFTEFYSRRSRESALDFLAQNRVSGEQAAELQKALDLSNGLAHREIYAMRLAAESSGMPMDKMPSDVLHTRLSAADRALSPQEKNRKARLLLFNKDYQRDKKQIISTLTDFLEVYLAKTREEQKKQSEKLGEALLRQRISVIALCALTILIFAIILKLIIGPLRSYSKCVREGRMLQPAGAYEFRRLAATYNEMYEIKARHDKLLKHQAEHDPLTGLMNRAAFESLKEALKSSGQSIALLLIDVDKFKQVNDTYGHVVGDRILCRVASLLTHNFRSNDYCIRLGGDELAVVARGKPDNMESIIQEKVESINKSLGVWDDDMPPVSISVGVAFSPNGFNDDLYGQADSALYKVKKAGRRGCAFYTPEDQPADKD